MKALKCCIIAEYLWGGGYERENIVYTYKNSYGSKFSLILCVCVCDDVDYGEKPFEKE